jgi:hypothetical protein
MRGDANVISGESEYCRLCILWLQLGLHIISLGIMDPALGSDWFKWRESVSEKEHFVC